METIKTIQTIIDENRADMKDNVYLLLCDTLKKLYLRETLENAELRGGIIGDGDTEGGDTEQDTELDNELERIIDQNE